MKTLTDLNRLPISMKKSLVKEVLPSYFVSEYPNLITFLDAYYDFLDSDENFGDLIQDLHTIRDVEANTLLQLDLVFKEIALGISHTQFTTPREVLRNFAKFFRVKGTEYSAEGFFRAFFGEDVTVEYPKQNLFIVGESEIGMDSLKVLQDGALYQVLSVLVKVPLSIATWGNLYKKFVHPGGFYLGAEVLIQTTQSTSLLGPSVFLDSDLYSDSGEITISGIATLTGDIETDQDLSLIQTMGNTSYLLDSDGNYQWNRPGGLLETDSSYTDRNADSAGLIFTVRLEPNMQIRNKQTLLVSELDSDYTSIYDLMRNTYEYYAES